MKKYVLFVCGHNSGRSQMWEVYFNTYNKNPDVEARSAGTALKWDGKINPKVVDVLLKNSIDIHNQDKKYKPKMLTPDMSENAEEVFTMGCMDWCMVGDRKIDFDFWLDDPARDDTDIDSIFADFKMKMEPILKKYNS